MASDLHFWKNIFQVKYAVFRDLALYILSIFSTYTYMIGHYNTSIRIIDLVSRTTYVVCVNFLHEWRDLQFKVDFE